MQGRCPFLKGDLQIDTTSEAETVPHSDTAEPERCPVSGKSTADAQGESKGGDASSPKISSHGPRTKDVSTRVRKEELKPPRSQSSITPDPSPSVRTMDKS